MGEKIFYFLESETRKCFGKSIKIILKFKIVFFFFAKKVFFEKLITNIFEREKKLMEPKKNFTFLDQDVVNLSDRRPEFSRKTTFRKNPVRKINWLKMVSHVTRSSSLGTTAVISN